MELMLNVVSIIWTQLGRLTEVIEGDAVLLFPVAFVFAGGVVGITKRLLGLGRKRR